jgi:hypothetical protein
MWADFQNLRGTVNRASAGEEKLARPSNSSDRASFRGSAGDALSSEAPIRRSLLMARDMAMRTMLGRFRQEA